MPTGTPHDTIIGVVSWADELFKLFKLFKL